MFYSLQHNCFRQFALTQGYLIHVTYWQLALLLFSGDWLLLYRQKFVHFFLFRRLVVTVWIESPVKIAYVMFVGRAPVA